MIFDTILSIATLWTLRKGFIQFIQVSKSLEILQKTKPIDVNEAIKLLEDSSFNKVFVVVKGILKSNNAKNILSVKQVKDIRQNAILQNLKKKSYENIIKSAVQKFPYFSDQVEFKIKDLHTNDLIQVVNCHKTDLSGALTEVKSIQKMSLPTQNPILAFAKGFYNFIASLSPLNLFLKTTKVGSELNWYAILNDQYSTVIGQISKTRDNKIIFQAPKYVTKQKGYIYSKLIRRKNNISVVIIVLSVLFVYLSYKLGKLLLKYLKERSLKLIESKEWIEHREQFQDQKCNCIVCFENVRSIVFKPCRHYGLCRQCYSKLKKQICPYCKEPIKDIFSIVKKE